MNRISRTLRITLLIVVLIASLTACPPIDPDPPKNTLKIITPIEGQTVGGTIGVAAGVIDTTSLTNLKFKLGSLEVSAEADGAAVLNTRSLSDGTAILEASANLAGVSVTTKVNINVKNDLPSSGTVTSTGGALKTINGSLAMLEPGALSSPITLSVTDLSQEKIKQDFKVDYPALGVTFLGALDVKAQGASKANVPIQVDLKGWAEKVQPNHQVVMFGLAPDIDGDGIGELMAVADAQATPDGSVITTPIAKAEVSTQAIPSTLSKNLHTRTTSSTSNLVPGSILRLSARGFIPGSAFSNVAIFEPGGIEVFARPTNLEKKIQYRPLMSLDVAIPNLPVGNASVKFKNLVTGYSSESVSLTIAEHSSSDAWVGFKMQIKTAMTKLVQGRSAGFKANISNLLTALDAVAPGKAANMVAASGLVNAANQALLEGIAPGAYSSEQFKLVEAHALMLDAIAASVTGFGTQGADLAGLLLMVSPATTASSQSRGVRADPDPPANPCSAPGTEDFGSTGMGSAPPPGGQGCGSAGGSSGSPSGTNSALGSSTRTRDRGFKPIAGAIVRVFKRGTFEKLSPFTSITDEHGYYYVPFIAEGQPFTISAFDPITKRLATADGVGVGYGQGTYVPLVFEPEQINGNAPISSFTQTFLPQEPLYTFEFDPSASSANGTSKLQEFIWDFGDGTNSNQSLKTKVRHQFKYRSSGSYTVRLTIIDNLNQTGSSSQAITTPENQAPVAVAGGNQTTTTRTTITLNGSGSSDPDGNTLSFKWVLTNKPSGSNSVLFNSTSSSSSFVADKTGQYEVSLTVSDGSLSNTDTATITVAGQNQVVWDGGGDGTSWSDGKNWVGDLPPLDGDRVLIDIPGNANIILNAFPTVNIVLQSLICKEQLTVEFGSLGVLNDSSIETLELKSGTLKGAGNITVNTMRWLNGSLEGAAGTKLTVNTALELQSLQIKERFLDTRNLINKGTATIRNGLLYFKNGAVFTNDLGATTTLTDPQAGNFAFVSYGAASPTRIINAGNINVALTVDAIGTGIGTSNVDFTNLGIINVNTGIFESRNTLELGGVSNVADGASLRVFSGLTNLTGVLNSPGTGILDLSRNTGTFEVKAGSSFNVNNTNLMGGNLNANSGSSLNLPNLKVLNNGILGGSDNLSITNLTWAEGTIKGSGTATVTSSLIMPSGQHWLDNKALVNKGTAVVQGGELILQNNAVFTNDVGATLTDSHVGIFAFTIFGDGPSYRIVNAGTMNIAPTADVNGNRETTGNYMPFINTGTINVNAGRFEWRSAVELGGIVNLADGASLRLSGATSLTGATDLLTGVFNGTGTGTLEIAGGTVNLTSGSYAIPNTNLTGGTLRASGTLNTNVSNAATLEIGTGIAALAVNTYTQTATGRLNLEVDGSGTFDQLNCSGTATLAGTLGISKLGIDPAANSSFASITAGSLSGSFSSVFGATFGTGRSFVPTYTATGMTLKAL